MTNLCDVYVHIQYMFDVLHAFDILLSQHFNTCM